MKDVLYSGNHYIDRSDVCSKLVWGKHYVQPPLLTVAIPAYKRGDILKETINSILNQRDFSDYQILITDDEQIDDYKMSEVYQTVSELNSEKVVLYHNMQNLGVVHNWNRCLELSQSEYVCTLDDDDLIDSAYFCEAMNILKRHPDIDLLGTLWKYYDHKKGAPIEGSMTVPSTFFGKRSEKCKEDIAGKLTKIDQFLIYPHIAFLLSGSIIKKETAIRLGGFNPDWYPSMDYGFMANAALMCNTYVYNKVLCYSRLHENTSGKPDSVKRFCTSDFKIHESMKMAYPAPLRPLYSLANHVMIYSQLSGLNKFWNTNVCTTEIEEELHFSKFYRSKLARGIAVLFLKILSVCKISIKLKNTMEI